MTTIPQRLCAIAEQLSMIGSSLRGTCRTQALEIAKIAVELESAPAAPLNMFSVHMPNPAYADPPVYAYASSRSEDKVEAPAADAPKVVAWEYARRYGSGVSFARPDDYTDEDGELVTPTALIRERDHLATVAALQATIASQKAALIELTVENEQWASDFPALQARINALEARQAPEGSMPITQGQLSEMLAKSFMDGVKRGAEKFAASMVERGLVTSLPQPDTSKEQP